MTGPPAAFADCWQPLADIGRAPDGGYHRLAFGAADLAARQWFRDQAANRGLSVEQDRNGNLWAWWGAPGPGAIATGSHLDTVPGGGAFDGPLGVVSGLLAVDRLAERQVRPRRPLAVVVFADEEGARFGTACVGSRLLTGALDPARLVDRRDPDGVTLGTAFERGGVDPDRLGPDPARLRQLAAFVELHIEQGRGLARQRPDTPVGIASAVWPHGRWRLDFHGTSNHAGTTRLSDRNDPVLPLAATVLAARRAAETSGGAVATVGRIAVEPGAVNAVAARATGWLDARAPAEPSVRQLVEAIRGAAVDAAARHGVAVEVVEESWSPPVEFAAELRDLLGRRVAATVGAAPVLATGAGHDAAVLAGHLPAAMLFVRNPTGVSHSPAEHASVADCLAGIEALTAVLEELVGR